MSLVKCYRLVSCVWKNFSHESATKSVSEVVMADSSWGSWFASPDDHDDAFDARIAAVRGLIEGATEERPEAMRKQLETLKAKTKVERADLMELQDIEAEAALYADKNALYAI